MFLDQECEPQLAFWTTDGAIVRTLRHLASAIEGMRDYSFQYHVNKDHNKNDFADWIRDVIKDDELAMRLEGVMEKNKYISIIRARLRELNAK